MLPAAVLYGPRPDSFGPYHRERYSRIHYVKFIQQYRLDPQPVSRVGIRVDIKRRAATRVTAIEVTNLLVQAQGRNPSVVADRPSRK